LYITNITKGFIFMALTVFYVLLRVIGMVLDDLKAMFE